MPLPKFPGHEKDRLVKLEEQRRIREHIQDEQKLLAVDEWQFGRELGRGSFGRVVEAMLSRTGELMAVKQIQMKPNSQRGYLLAQQEIDLMRKLRHPNIVAIKGAFIDEDDVFNIAMELVPGRSLDDMRQVMGAFHENVVRRFTRQILLALEYCHRNGCVHRDVKGKNVLMGLDGVVRLADFGSAAVLNERLIQDAVDGNDSYTPLWVAPEVVMAGACSEKIDIWALGCVAIEMASGKDPWSEKGFATPFQAITYIGTKDEIPLIPSTLSEVGQDFCRRCLTRNPDLRPSASELLKHPFVNAAMGEEVVRPPSAASSPRSSSIQSVVAGSSPTGLLDGLLGGAQEVAQQLQRMSALVATKTRTIVPRQGRGRTQQEDIRPPASTPPPYPFGHLPDAAAMAALDSSRASSADEGAAAGWCDGEPQPSWKDSAHSGGRVFHYSHGEDRSHSGSVQISTSRTSSVLSFVEVYRGLGLHDQEPGAPQ